MLNSHRRSHIQCTLRGMANDAIASMKLRVRPPGEVIPDPPNEDFGYEDVGDGITAGFSISKIAAVLGEAASYQRWHRDGRSNPDSDGDGDHKSASSDSRAFKRLLDHKVELNATSNTVYLLGGACWTLGARYASPPLALTIYGEHRESVNIIAGAKAYATKHGVIGELYRYTVNIPDLASYCNLDEWITRFEIAVRPITLDVILDGLYRTDVRDLDDDADNREKFFAWQFERWSEREQKRMENRLSPLAALCVKQSYLNVLLGRKSWWRPREHHLLLAARQEAANDEIYQIDTPASYALLADYLLVDESRDFAKRHLEFGIDPDGTVDRYGNPL